MPQNTTFELDDHRPPPDNHQEKVYLVSPTDSITHKEVSYVPGTSGPRQYRWDGELAWDVIGLGAFLYVTDHQQFGLYDRMTLSPFAPGVPQTVVIPNNSGSDHYTLAEINGEISGTEASDLLTNQQLPWEVASAR